VVPRLIVFVVLLNATATHRCAVRRTAPEGITPRTPLVGLAGPRFCEISWMTCK
jgi:hypothetical protein